MKDLSRLGRDHLMTGYYMEVFFPDNDVQFIAVYDNYDSENGDNDFAPFKNIINEWYTSLPKIANKLNAHKSTFSPAKRVPKLKTSVLLIIINYQKRTVNNAYLPYSLSAFIVPL